eukprot:TRINITY_DN19538_c0_g1_i1.p4 TRINITY_DN19538_c0_g1~~TRINITY_DN19538_c0_g1_i1.p4  ORF type:complete len:229 (-),score=67.90 TRINITY_DN19538_c0_g1_i1:335-1021(-)
MAQFLPASSRSAENGQSKAKRPFAASTIKAETDRGDRNGSNGENGSGELLREIELQRVVAEMLLKDAQDLRQINNVLYRVFEVKNDALFLSAIKETGLEYTKNTRGKRGHSFGPPWWHTWVTLIKYAVDSAGDFKTKDKGEYDKLVMYMQGIKQPDDLKDTVYQFRCKEEKEGRYVLMQLRVEGEAAGALAVVLKILQGDIVCEKKGQAPPSHNERLLQKHLTALKKK